MGRAPGRPQDGAGVFDWMTTREYRANWPHRASWPQARGPRERMPGECATIPRSLRWRQTSPACAKSARCLRSSYPVAPASTSAPSRGWRPRSGSPASAHSHESLAVSAWRQPSCGATSSRPKPGRPWRELVQSSEIQHGWSIGRMRRWSPSASGKSTRTAVRLIYLAVGDDANHGLAHPQ